MRTIYCGALLGALTIAFSGCKGGGGASDPAKPTENKASEPPEGGDAPDATEPTADSDSNADTTGDTADDPGDDSGADSDANQTTVGSLAIADNGLAAAYPEGLTINAYPRAIAADPGAPAPGTVLIAALADPAPSQDDVISSQSNADKLQDAQDKIEGKGECFDGNVLQRFFANNYNVELCYNSEYGIVSGTVMGTADRGQINPTLSGLGSGDSAAAKSLLEGISGLQPDTSNEVCMVAVSRNIIRDATTQLDASLNLLQGILCQAKKSGVDTLPAVGADALDLTKIVNDALPPNAGGNTAITGVHIKRVADKNENPVYQTSITFETTGGDANETFQSVKLVHSPSKDGNDNYTGTMFIKGTRVEGSKTSTIARSMTYVKTASEDAQRLIFDVRGAHFPYSATFTADSDPFVAGRVNFAAGASGAGLQMGPPLNNTVENATYVVFDVNPSSNAGKIGAWTAPGGSPGGFVAETVQDPETGKLAGCAWAGSDRDSTLQDRLAADEAVRPTGCFTNLITDGDCGPATDNAGPQVWKQCFAQDNEGVYKVDAVKTTPAKGYEVIDATQADVPELSVSGLTSPLE